MTVTVYARHSLTCPKQREKHAGQYKRRKCPRWLRWGKHGKKSAKTRSWDIATKSARKLEQDLEMEALGIEVIKKEDHIIIDAATDLYLGDMAQRGIKDPSKARRMLARLRDHANAREIILLKDVNGRLLTEWRNKWTFKAKSGSPAVHWSVVKTFFRWAFATDLIAADPSAKLKSLPSERNQVQPLTQDEMGRLITATAECGFGAEVAHRVKTFILLQRWSGLACMDAATLRRDGLKDNNNLVRGRRFPARIGEVGHLRAREVSLAELPVEVKTFPDSLCQTFCMALGENRVHGRKHRCVVLLHRMLLAVPERLGNSR